MSELSYRTYYRKPLELSAKTEVSTATTHLAPKHKLKKPSLKSTLPV